MNDGSTKASSGVAFNVAASDRPLFGVKDDIRRERKPPDRNILDRDRIVDGLKQWGLVIVFLAIVVTFSVLRPTTFMTWQNAINIVNNSSSLLLFAQAATLALIIGEFDLSFVAVADLVAVLVGVLVTGFGWTSGPAIAGALVLGLVCGAAIGAVNGLFVAKAFVPSFVTTLAVGSIAAGLELAAQAGITGGMKQISVVVLPAPLQALGSMTVLGSPIKATVVLVFLFCLSVLGGLVDRPATDNSRAAGVCRRRQPDGRLSFGRAGGGTTHRGFCTYRFDRGAGRLDRIGRARIFQYGVAAPAAARVYGGVSGGGGSGEEKEV
jgi:Branched-chain amino acid transport system / permease component